MTALLPEPVRRWIRLQRELGVDEIFLDAPWTAPVQESVPSPARRGAPEARRPAPAPSAPPEVRRQAPPPPPTRPSAPVRPAAAPPPIARPMVASTAAAPQVSSSLNQRSQPPRAPAVPTFSDIASLREHARSCTRCILHGKRKAHIMEGGAERSSWAIVTLYGWADDNDRGRLLSGDYAKAFLDLVKASGLEEPVVLPVLACSPHDPADTTIQGFTEAVRCRPHWLQALRLHGVRAVLVLDHKATQLVRGPSAPVTWPAFRGETWAIEGIPAVSTHHPARLARSAALAPEIAADLARLKNILEKTP